MFQLTKAQDEYILNMPKAELHVHLEGSITPATLLSLARRHSVLDRLPAQDVDGVQEWFRFTDFSHFVEIYLTISDCLRTPEDFAFIVEAYAQTAAAQNICYAEMTFTPFIHTHIQSKGLTIDNLLEGLAAGRQTAQQVYGVEIYWIFDVPRNFSFRNTARQYDPMAADTTLHYALTGLDHGVVGFGLGGDEVGAPPAPFAHAFHKAIDAGLMSAPHAGETEGPASVWGAIQSLRAQRLGHGVRAVEDAELLSLLAATQIPLEVNISSNICLHVYDSISRHPFPFLDQMGLLVTVNSDDPPLFNTTLAAEYRLLATHFGYDLPNVARIARNAFRAAAQPPDRKRRLIEQFDQWLTAEDHATHKGK